MQLLEMKRVLVSELEILGSDKLWGRERKEPYRVVYEDGEEIDQTWIEIAISSVIWPLLRHYNIKITSTFAINRFLKGGEYTTGTHSNFLGFVLFAIAESFDDVDMDYLCFKIVECRDMLYNHSINVSGDAVMSLDFLDVIGIITDPVVSRINRDVQETKESCNAALSAVSMAMECEDRLRINSLVRMARTGVVKKSQLLQCVAPRATVTEIDSTDFPNSIPRGYAMGLRRIDWSLMESASARKSIYFAHNDLRNTEYRARRLQLLQMNVRRLHPGDCGSTKYLDITVGEKDMSSLVGSYYLNEETGRLEAIRKNMTHLIGRRIKKRYALGCFHADESGVCATCFGELSRAVFGENNLGHMCTVTLTEKMSQAVLSTKHLDGATSIELITIPEQYRRFLRSSKDGVSYYVNQQLRGRVKIRVPMKSVFNISDVFEVEDVGQIVATRISEFKIIGFEVDTGRVQEATDIIVGQGHKAASLSEQFLGYLREKKKMGEVPYEIDDGVYVFDITDFDKSLPIFTLPMRNYNMADYAREISGLIETSQKNLTSRGKFVTPENLLMELYETVSAKLTISMSVLEVIVLGACIRDPKKYDYRIPRGDSERSLATLNNLMAYRSFGPPLSYQGHAALLMDPMSYLISNRPDHPIDYMFMPQEIYEYRKKAARNGRLKGSGSNIS